MGTGEEERFGGGVEGGIAHCEIDSRKEDSVRLIEGVELNSGAKRTVSIRKEEEGRPTFPYQECPKVSKVLRP